MTHKTYRPNSKALLDPCFDEVFKALFTQNSPESRNALTDFLTNLLDRKIAKLTLLPNEPPVDDDKDKQTRFDIACIFDDGKMADIEMQGRNEDTAYERRAEYLCARLLNYSVPSGMNWQDIPQVFQISLVGFNVDLDDPKPVSWFEMRKSTGLRLSDTQNIIFLELPKIRRMLREQGPIPPENLPKIIKWCIFLSEAGNPKMAAYINDLVKTEDGIMQAHTVLRKISTNDYLWKKELDEEVVARDRRSFKQACREEVKVVQKKLREVEKKTAQAEDKAAVAEDRAAQAEGRAAQAEGKAAQAERKVVELEKESQSQMVAVVRAMQAKGMTFATISECTGLTEEECKRICR